MKEDKQKGFIMEIVIRDLVQNDLSQLSSLYKQFRDEESDVVKMEEEFLKITEENKHIILVAEMNHKIIGSVMGVICRELYGDCRPFMVIENMIVDNDLRRSGLGQKLMFELEKRAIKNNCVQMILVTEAGRTDACRFYEKLGFQKGNKGYKKKLD